MAQPNGKASKAYELKKHNRSAQALNTHPCRRCGDDSCRCSDDERDAGGPAL
jgi:hypothetical protein